MMSEEKKKCVWMTSGLISYKLCAYNYKCEECMFDRAMRSGTAASESRQYSTSVPAASQANRPNMHIMEDYFYHQQHCWVKVENPDCVKVGIDGILAKFITGIKTVVLPRPNETLYRGQCFAHIIQQRYVIPLISPLAGLIQSVNSGLEKNPELLINDFCENGWLITIKPENLEQDLRTLIFGRKAVEWYKKKEREVIEASYAMLNQSEVNPGLTIQDGGEIIPDLADMLTSEQYYQIFELLSRTDEAI
jgi:glycine cleavage system H lipoate-binding protein